MSLRVLGIDPGLRVTGYGVVEQGRGSARLIEAGVVAPPSSGSLETRLRQLHAGIGDVLTATNPQWIVIEELYTTYKNPLTAIMMGHARGVLCLAGAQHGIPVRTLGHSLVKRALVGSGAARKEQVNLMITELLGLRRAPEPNDVSDALALALAFINVRDHEQRFPAEMLNLPKRRRRTA
ncbi:MAG TPA: crossover junction endodeoxyribonuclease RuvC [Candidatus Baltobacteraceae bacterium]|jgi:crossover junction endodeoxyribonuclease RuvC